MAASTHKPGAPAVILFGSPGSGKGTQANLLRKCLGSPHISTGDMLRTHIDAKDAIGQETDLLIRSGKLVPDELVNQMVKDRLTEPDCRNGVILDGYPRTLQQAKVLLEFVKPHGFLPAVVYLVVDYEKIVSRLSGRRQCPVCGTLYNLVTNSPKMLGICDRDGALLITREDDRETVIRERLKEYELQTRPLLEQFRASQVPTFEIAGADLSPAEISKQICECLGHLGLVVGCSGNEASGSNVGVRL